MKSTNFVSLIKLQKLCAFDHQIELYLGIWKKHVRPVSLILLINSLTPREDKGDREGIPHTHPIP